MNKQQTRTVARFAAVASSLVLLAAGCAKGSGGATQSSESADFAQSSESGTLTIMGFSGVDEIATTRMDRAEAALEGTKIDLIEGGLDIQQFLSALAAGDPPDLIYANRDQVGSLAARGAIVALDG